MKQQTIILDTGPLVAALNKTDKYHDWAMKKFLAFPMPYYTCEAVLTESIYLLKKFLDKVNALKAVGSIFSLLESKDIIVDFECSQHLTRLKRLMSQYHHRIDFADACIVAMTEQRPFKNAKVLTLDRKDFSYFQRNDNEPIIFEAP